MAQFHSHNSHGFGADVPAKHSPDHGNIARDAEPGSVVGRGKSVEYHGSATAAQLAGIGAGIAKPTESGGQPGSVFDKPPLPKALHTTPVATNPGTPRDANGMIHDPTLGHRVLGEAVKSGGKC